MKESQKSTSTALVSTHSKKVESRPSRVDEVFSEIESICSSDKEEEEEEEEDTDELNELADGMAMLASKFKRFRRKGAPSNQSRYPARFSSEKPRIKPAFDKSEAECYNCGKKGHFAADCRSKKMVQSQPSNQVSKAVKYKAKYKRLKAQTTQGKGKGLVAETCDWADSETSSDDKDVIANLCLMTLTEASISSDESNETYSATVDTSLMANSLDLSFVEICPSVVSDTC